MAEDTALRSDVPDRPLANGADSPRNRKFISAGDLVIVFMSRDKPPVPVTVTPGLEMGNAYGIFSHNEMMGLPFGAKLASRNRKGFIHLLRPSPELWTLALPHRTQIVYTPDMSFIAANLGLTPGARVIEAGTGSGSFSHYLVRTVARHHEQSRGVGWKGKAAEAKAQPQRGGRRVTELQNADSMPEDSEEEQIKTDPANQREAEILRLLAQNPEEQVGPKQGRVWSFEFHAGRAVKAWQEFEDHQLFPTISLRHRNVCKVGFGLRGVADAVFLDLPAPWEALHHAAQALRSDIACKICCFSPCVEQVLKTVAALRQGDDGREGQSRWVDIETYECLTRTHMGIWVGAGGQTTNAPIDEAILRIRMVEEKKVKRREAQIERVKRERQERAEAILAAEGNDAVPADDHNDDAQINEQARLGEKRKREHEGVERPSTGKTTDTTPTVVQTRDGKSLHRANVYARTFPEMKGHTSYLTFATLLPRTIRQDTADVSKAKPDAINAVSDAVIPSST